VTDLQPTKMGSFSQDLEMMSNINGDMMNNGSMMNPMDMGMYSDDMDVDVGNPVYNPMESTSGQHADSEQKDRNENQLSSTGVGAGPLPTGFGAPSAQNSGSTLTEFTKRRNWSQRVLEEIKDMLYILTPDGRLLYVSPSVKLLTGYEPRDLNGKFISEFIHADDSALFVREFNESIATGNPLRFFYRFRTSENNFIIFEAHGHPHLTSEGTQLQITGAPTTSAGYCRGFFMMARPYPTKNSELLDSFLEHKIENERLHARIAALKHEEAEEAEAAARHYQKKLNGHDSVTISENTDLGDTPRSTSMGDYTDSSSMPPPAKPTVSNTALTREALDEANSFSRPDSITDKMARYEGSSHVDSIEIMTGLLYREGERSHGISTGGTSPALIRGDAGIDIPADKSDPRYNGGGFLDKRPKKVKSADEYVCTDCGTLDSPEWRKGPNGPKTLCNACGLRWAKKEKKVKGPGSAEVAGSNSQTPGMSGLPQHNSNGSG
jgi:PAS domain S-box-containing protein